MRSLAATCAALVLTCTLAACGDDPATAGDPATHQYDGPLYVERAHARHPKAGAAGDVVQCDTWGRGGFNDAPTYSEGATADSPAEALEVARSERGFLGFPEGLLVAKLEDDRVLYVAEVDGVVKQAVIVRDGPATEGAGGPGWYVESWAACDYSELAVSFTEPLGYQVWTDATGKPVPTTKLEAWLGPEHCDWQSMVFLTVGKDTYVSEPVPDLKEYFVDSFRPHAKVPDDAVATGYQRDGAHLWLAADRSVVYVGATDDAELWPRVDDSLGCA